jgi:hypothetical protein
MSTISYDNGSMFIDDHTTGEFWHVTDNFAGIRWLEAFYAGTCKLVVCDDFGDIVPAKSNRFTRMN